MQILILNFGNRQVKAQSQYRQEAIYSTALQAVFLQYPFSLLTIKGKGEGKNNPLGSVLVPWLMVRLGGAGRGITAPFDTRGPRHHQENLQ